MGSNRALDGTGSYDRSRFQYKEPSIDYTAGGAIVINSNGALLKDTIDLQERVGALPIANPQATPVGYKPDVNTDISITLYATESSNLYRNYTVNEYNVVILPYELPPCQNGVPSTQDLRKAINDVNGTRLRFGDTTVQGITPELFGLVINGKVQNVFDNDGGTLIDAGGKTVTVARGPAGLRITADYNSKDIQAEHLWVMNKSDQVVQACLSNQNPKDAARYLAQAIQTRSDYPKAVIGATDLPPGDSCCYAVPKEYVSVCLLRAVSGIHGNDSHPVTNVIKDVFSNDWVAASHAVLTAGEQVVFAKTQTGGIAPYVLPQKSCIYCSSTMLETRGQFTISASN